MAAREARAVGYQLDVRADGLHRARSTVGPDHRGCGRRSVSRRRGRRCSGRGFQGGELPGAPEQRHRRSEALGRLRGGAGRSRLRRGRPVRLELWNVYLPPFKAAVDAGAGNLMTAYMGLNGIPAAGTVAVHRGAARHLGFRGLSRERRQGGPESRDARLRGRPGRCRAARSTPGVDMEMAVLDPAYGHLTEALTSGEANCADDRRGVRRVLTAKFRMGPSRHRSSTRTGRARFLPIRHIVRSPASRRTLSCAPPQRGRPATAGGRPPVLDRGRSGRWRTRSATPSARGSSTSIWTKPSPCWPGSALGSATASHGRPCSRPAGPSACFRRRSTGWIGGAIDDPEGFDEDAEFRQAVELAGNADVAIVVAGEWQHMIGEGASRSSIELPGRQLELLQAIVDTGTPLSFWS